MRERAPDHDFAWLLDVLWTAGGLQVSGQRSPGATAYVVVPGRKGARAILPADGAAARAALLAAAGTRSPTAQRARAVVAQLVRAGLLRRRLYVDPDDPLRRAIAEAVGERVELACAVRVPGPFRKPVLQIVGSGRVVAYAKVAWNTVTAANVAAEHRALVALAAEADPALSGPEPIAMLDHRGYPVLLTRPMPPELRRFDPSRDTVDPAIARLVGRLAPPSAGDDPIGGRLRSRLRASTGGSLDVIASEVGVLVDAIGSRTARLPAGAWHGDWSPWNLGWVGDRLWAWDWEYCRTDVPVGLDVPHFAFQRRFIGAREPLERAFAEARDTTAEALSRLGYPPEDRATIHAVHVAELAIRYLEADALGVAPNPRFVEGAAAALRAAAEHL
jgi:hypothetical protein